MSDKKFIAYVKQKYPGHYNARVDLKMDKNIGCGYTLWEIEASTYDKAVKKIKEMVVSRGDGGYVNDQTGKIVENDHSSDMLTSVTMFEILSAQKLSVNEWYEEIKQQRIVEVAMIKKEKELKQLAKLKEKYE